jgi:CheY-like chemotaxis protein
MNAPGKYKEITILLVEDNPGDVLLTTEALNDFRITNKLHVTETGVEALDFLHRRGRYEQAPRPDLILLDLNLPQKNGREVLAEIKQDNRLKHIPVIILTSSRSEEDILTTYGLHANCYITKPIGLESFIKVVQSIETFWLTIVKLP